MLIRIVCWTNNKKKTKTEKATFQMYRLFGAQLTALGCIYRQIALHFCALLTQNSARIGSEWVVLGNAGDKC